MRQRLTLSLFLCAAVLGGAALRSQAAAPAVALAGYWDTRISAAQGGTVTVVALVNSPVGGLELGFGGSPTGVELKDDGLSGDFGAGDGIYAVQIPLPPFTLGAPLSLGFDLLVKNGASYSSAGWPMLTVSEGGTATPTPTRTPRPSSTPTNTPTPTVTPTLNVAVCHPLASQNCLLPFPSSHFLIEDSESATGYKVNLPFGVMPNQDNPTRINIHDGFSPVNAMMAQFWGSVDSAQVPTFTDLNATMKGNWNFAVINADDGSDNRGKRHALHIERIINFETTLINMLPAEILEPDTRYIVAVRNLRDSSGGRVNTSDGFEMLRDNVSGGSHIEAVRADYEAIFEFLDTEMGVSRDSLDLAWEFHTASTDSLTKMMTGMVDEAIANYDASSADFNVTSVVNVRGGKVIRGELTGPGFLTDQDVFQLGPNDMPMPQEDHTFRVVVYVPRKAVEAPGTYPTVFLGHGIFGDADDVMIDVIEDLGWVGVAVDWQGLTSGAQAYIGLYVVSQIVTATNQISDRLMQSVVNAVIMRESLERIAEVVEDRTGAAYMDPHTYFATGISIGGMMTGVLTGVDPGIEVANLMVPGGGFSHLMQKSSMWTDAIGPTSFAGMVENFYPDPVAGKLALNMMQNVWDVVDPLSFSRHWSLDPLVGRPAKHVLIQMGVPDPVVQNFATSMLVSPTDLPQVGTASFRLPFQDLLSYPTDGSTFGGITQFPGEGHAAGSSTAAKRQRKAFFTSFTEQGRTPGEIIE